MDWKTRYAAEIGQTFAAAANEMGTYPTPLREWGLRLLEAADPISSEAGTNLIAFLLPFWLRETAGAEPERCAELAVGNVFAMLRFFLLDDVMDEGDKLGRERIAESLVLAERLQESFRQRYGRYYDADSPVWSAYRRYLETWGAAVCREESGRADPRDPARLAAKAAPVKLSAAALLPLAEWEERLPALEEAIDLALAALQLSDDWADWRGDLGTPNRNAFLELARERIGLPAEVGEDGTPLDERSVKRAIYREDALAALADIVEGYADRLREIEGAPEPLLTFVEWIRSGILKGAADAEETVRLLALGGGWSLISSAAAAEARSDPRSDPR